VVYPGVEPYLAGWYGSVREQTDRGFDLWISADGLDRKQVITAMGEDPEARWISVPAGAAPATLRSAAWQQLVASYPAVVLVDSDDVLEPSRIASARAGLETADVVGCALRISNASAVPLGPVLAPGVPDPDWETLLARHNVFGLSNTAYRADVLRACLPLPPNAVLIDWLLALRAWAAGATLWFDPVPRMRYRQHPGNVARVLPPFGDEYVLRAADLVAGHYERALGPDSGIPRARQARLREAQAGVLEFRRVLRASPDRLRRYVEGLNRLEPRYLWWWCVANSELEDAWKN
jgi:hypothetical protein